MPQPLLHHVEGDAPADGLHAEAVPQALGAGVGSVLGMPAAAITSCTRPVCRAEQNQATGRRKFRPLRRSLAELLANRKS